MAQEALGIEISKKLADIFSFGVTVFECFSWDKVDPKEQFKFPWQISTFVQCLEHALPNRQDTGQCGVTCV